MNLQMLQTVHHYLFMWGILMMATLKMSFFVFLQTSWRNNYCTWCIWHGSFLKEHTIPWEKVCGICTDGPPAMLGCLIWISAFGIEWVTKSHQKSLCDSLANISNEDNTTRVTRSNEKNQKFCQFCQSVLNSRLFLQVCSKLDAPNKTQIFQAEVRWLSKGKVLRHVFKLPDEFKTFFNQKTRL